MISAYAFRPTVFLPGARGRAEFWGPVAERLGGPSVLVGYPGFGDVLSIASVHSLSTLYDSILGMTPPELNLVAQSMRSVLALRAAIEQKPRVATLALIAPTGGFDVAGLGGYDWRASFREEHPSTPQWFAGDRSDFSAQLETIAAPTLIVCGDAENLSPLAVGDFLRKHIQDAELQVIAGGRHAVAYEEPERVAELLSSFHRRAA